MKIQNFLLVMFVPFLLANELPDPAKAFGARQSVMDISMSPDGNKIAYVSPQSKGQGSIAYAVDLQTGKTNLVAAADGNPQRIENCSWSANDRLVCTIYSVVKSADEIIPVTRLIAVNSDGTKMTSLQEPDSIYARAVALYGGSVVDWLPGEDGVVLYEKLYIPEVTKGPTRLHRKLEGLGVERLDTRNKKSKIVERPANNVSDYISDGRGKIRIKATQANIGATGMASQELRYFYRQSGSDKWLPLTTYNSATRQGTLPLAIDSTSNSAFALKLVNGRSALFQIKLDGTLQEELIYQHPQVDVGGLVRIGKARRPVGVRFTVESGEAEYFDPNLKRLARQLSKALPHLPLINFVDSSNDEKKLLIRASSDIDPGRYYVLDKTSKQLNEVMLSRPELEHAKLAKVKAITYSTADGVKVPAYLTLPPGKDNNLPALVMPHGGPSARDTWGFDWLAQFFAHQGYAVIQPNFRGSAGYGQEWYVENGFKSWETAINDINGAGRYLISTGIADAEKLGIFGWSYGGYAALQSNVVDPDLFKAVVAVAPVTDLALLKEEWRGWTNFRLTRDFIGTGPHIAAGSPARHASKIKAPVLLFHGTLDRNVGVRESQVMNTRLKEAGGEVDYVEFKKLDHYLEDSTARAEMLRKTDAFLKKHLKLQ